MIWIVIALIIFIAVIVDITYTIDITSKFSEEIINVLAKIDGLKVIGRTSSFSFKEEHIDLVQIGKMSNTSLQTSDSNNGFSSITHLRMKHNEINNY